MTKRLLLLKNLFMASSPVNTIKNTEDKKKKNKAIGGLVGQIVIFLMVIAYCSLQAFGIAYIGMASTLPALCANLVCLMSFFLTILKTNGYMFAFKEYDMLMSMPFSVKTIVADKFLYMYSKNMIWSLGISVSMLIFYGMFEKPGPMAYISWLILGALLPLIPMVVASTIGALIAGVGSGFRYKKLVQMLLVFIVVIPMFFLRFIIEKIVRDDSLNAVLGKITAISDSGAGMYLPAKWFSEAVTGTNISSLLLFVALSVLVFELFVLVVSRFYRGINSRLMTSSLSKHKKEASYTKKSVVNSVAFKEFKTFLGSTAYATNVGMGVVLCLVIGLAALFFDGQTIVNTVTQGAPVDAAVVVPALPLFIYLFTGMVSSTCCSPSLEGKNYWIIKTMPVDAMDIYRGKMLFNLLLFGPVGALSVLSLCLSFKAGVVMTLLSLGLICVLTVFSTFLGMVFGIKHMKLDWNNDIEVVKQGAAVGFYLAINMVMTIVMMVGSIALGFIIKSELVLLIFLVIITGVCLFLYKRIKVLAYK